MSIAPSDVLLTDRVAVVTGGGAGIGRGIAAGLTAFGARVAIWERDPESCSSAADGIGALGITTDVRDTGQVDAALAQTVAELGPVTILVNNAGGVFHSSILETSENGWDALYKANLRHVYLCTQRVARGIVDASLSGSIISVTSIEGVRAAPGYATYAAAKAGVINYTKTAALELAQYGIRVNALAPDITMTEGMMQVAPPGAEERFGYTVPMGRAGHATKWPALQSSWPRTCRVTSPARPSTSTVAHRRHPAGITIPRRATTSWAPPDCQMKSEPPSTLTVAPVT